MTTLQPLPPLTPADLVDPDAAALQVATNTLQDLPPPLAVAQKAVGNGLTMQDMADFYTAYFATGSALVSATELCTHQIEVTPNDPGNLQQEIAKLATKLGLLRTTEQTMRLSQGPIRPPKPETIRNAQYLAAGLGKLQQRDMKVASVLALLDSTSQVVAVVTA